ncbi:unnamed protein product, partial [Phaeothamnion confervicola]
MWHALIFAVAIPLALALHPHLFGQLIAAVANAVARTSSNLVSVSIGRADVLHLRTEDVTIASKLSKIYIARISVRTRLLDALFSLFRRKLIALNIEGLEVTVTKEAASGRSSSAGTGVAPSHPSSECGGAQVDDNCAEPNSKPLLSRVEEDAAANVAGGGSGEEEGVTIGMIPPGPPPAVPAIAKWAMRLCALHINDALIVLREGGSDASDDIPPSGGDRSSTCGTSADARLEAVVMARRLVVSCDHGPMPLAFLLAVSLEEFAVELRGSPLGTHEAVFGAADSQEAAAAAAESVHSYSADGGAEPSGAKVAGDSVGASETVQYAAEPVPAGGEPLVDALGFMVPETKAAAAPPPLRAGPHLRLWHCRCGIGVTLESKPPPLPPPPLPAPPRPSADKARPPLRFASVGSAWFSCALADGSCSLQDLESLNEMHNGAAAGARLAVATAAGAEQSSAPEHASSPAPLEPHPCPPPPSGLPPSSIPPLGCFIVGAFRLSCRDWMAAGAVAISTEPLTLQIASGNFDAAARQDLGGLGATMAAAAAAAATTAATTTATMAVRVPPANSAREAADSAGLLASWDMPSPTPLAATSTIHIPSLCFSVPESAGGGVVIDGIVVRPSVELRRILPPQASEATATRAPQEASEQAAMAADATAAAEVGRAAGPRAAAEVVDRASAGAAALPPSWQPEAATGVGGEPDGPDVVALVVLEVALSVDSVRGTVDSALSHWLIVRQEWEDRERAVKVAAAAAAAAAGGPPRRPKALQPPVHVRVRTVAVCLIEPAAAWSAESAVAAGAADGGDGRSGVSSGREQRTAALPAPRYDISAEDVLLSRGTEGALAPAHDLEAAWSDEMALDAAVDDAERAGLPSASDGYDATAAGGSSDKDGARWRDSPEAAMFVDVRFEAAQCSVVLTETEVLAIDAMLLPSALADAGNGGSSSGESCDVHDSAKAERVFGSARSDGGLLPAIAATETLASAKTAPSWAPVPLALQTRVETRLTLRAKRLSARRLEARTAAGVLLAIEMLATAEEAEGAEAVGSTFSAEVLRAGGFAFRQRRVRGTAATGASPRTEGVRGGVGIGGGGSGYDGEGEGGVGEGAGAAGTAGSSGGSRHEDVRLSNIEVWWSGDVHCRLMQLGKRLPNTIDLITGQPAPSPPPLIVRRVKVQAAAVHCELADLADAATGSGAAWAGEVTGEDCVATRRSPCMDLALENISLELEKHVSGANNRAADAEPSQAKGGGGVVTLASERHAFGTGLLMISLPAHHPDVVQAQLAELAARRGMSAPTAMAAAMAQLADSSARSRRSSLEGGALHVSEAAAATPLLSRLDKLDVSTPPSMRSAAQRRTVPPVPPLPLSRRPSDAAVGGGGIQILTATALRIVREVSTQCSGGVDGDGCSSSGGCDCVISSGGDSSSSGGSGDDGGSGGGSSSGSGGCGGGASLRERVEDLDVCAGTLGFTLPPRLQWGSLQQATLRQWQAVQATLGEGSSEPSARGRTAVSFGRLSLLAKDETAGARLDARNGSPRLQHRRSVAFGARSDLRHSASEVAAMAAAAMAATAASALGPQSPATSAAAAAEPSVAQQQSPSAAPVSQPCRMTRQGGRLMQASSFRLRLARQKRRRSSDQSPRSEPMSLASSTIGSPRLDDDLHSVGSPVAFVRMTPKVTPAAAAAVAAAPLPTTGWGAEGEQGSVAGGVFAFSVKDVSYTVARDAVAAAAALRRLDSQMGGHGYASVAGGMAALRASDVEVVVMGLGVPLVAAKSVEVDGTILQAALAPTADSTVMLVVPLSATHNHPLRGGTGSRRQELRLQVDQMAPKLYIDTRGKVNGLALVQGRCLEPVMEAVGIAAGRLVPPDPRTAEPLPFWDRFRYMLHGCLDLSLNNTQCTMLLGDSPRQLPASLRIILRQAQVGYRLGQFRVTAADLLVSTSAAAVDEVSNGVDDVVAAADEDVGDEDSGDSSSSDEASSSRPGLLPALGLRRASSTGMGSAILTATGFRVPYRRSRGLSRNPFGLRHSLALVRALEMNCVLAWSRRDGGDPLHHHVQLASPSPGPQAPALGEGRGSLLAAGTAVAASMAGADNPGFVAGNRGSGNGSGASGGSAPWRLGVDPLAGFRASGLCLSLTAKVTPGAPPEGIGCWFALRVDLLPWLLKIGADPGSAAASAQEKGGGGGSGGGARGSGANGDSGPGASNSGDDSIARRPPGLAAIVKSFDMNVAVEKAAAAMWRGPHCQRDGFLWAVDEMRVTRLSGDNGARSGGGASGGGGTDGGGCATSDAAERASRRGLFSLFISSVSTSMLDVGACSAAANLSAGAASLGGGMPPTPSSSGHKGLVAAPSVFPVRRSSSGGSGSGREITGGDALGRNGHKSASSGTGACAIGLRPPPLRGAAARNDDPATVGSVADLSGIGLSVESGLLFAALEAVHNRTTERDFVLSANTITYRRRLGPAQDSNEAAGAGGKADGGGSIGGRSGLPVDGGHLGAANGAAGPTAAAVVLLDTPRILWNINVRDAVMLFVADLLDTFSLGEPPKPAADPAGGAAPASAARSHVRHGSAPATGSADVGLTSGAGRQNVLPRAPSSTRNEPSKATMGPQAPPTLPLRRMDSALIEQRTALAAGVPTAVAPITGEALAQPQLHEEEEVSLTICAPPVPPRRRQEFAALGGGSVAIAAAMAYDAELDKDQLLSRSPVLSPSLSCDDGWTRDGGGNRGWAGEQLRRLGRNSDTRCDPLGVLGPAPGGSGNDGGAGSGGSGGGSGTGGGGSSLLEFFSSRQKAAAEQRTPRGQPEGLSLEKPRIPAVMPAPTPTALADAAAAGDLPGTSTNRSPWRMRRWNCVSRGQESLPVQEAPLGLGRSASQSPPSFRRRAREASSLLSTAPVNQRAVDGARDRERAATLFPSQPSARSDAVSTVDGCYSGGVGGDGGKKSNGGSGAGSECMRGHVIDYAITLVRPQIKLCGARGSLVLSAEEAAVQGRTYLTYVRGPKHDAASELGTARRRQHRQGAAGGGPAADGMLRRKEVDVTISCANVYSMPTDIDIRNAARWVEFGWTNDDSRQSSAGWHSSPAGDAAAAAGEAKSQSASAAVAPTVAVTTTAAATTAGAAAGATSPSLSRRHGNGGPCDESDRAKAAVGSPSAASDSPRAMSRRSRNIKALDVGLLEERLPSDALSPTVPKGGVDTMGLRQVMRDFSVRSTYLMFSPLSEAEAAAQAAACAAGRRPPVRRMPRHPTNRFKLDVPELVVGLDSQQFYEVLDVARNLLLAPPPPAVYERLQARRLQRRQVTCLLSEQLLKSRPVVPPKTAALFGNRRGSGTGAAHDFQYDVGKEADREALKDIVVATLAAGASIQANARVVTRIEYHIGRCAWRLMMSPAEVAAMTQQAASGTGGLGVGVGSMGSSGGPAAVADQLEVGLTGLRAWHAYMADPSQSDIMYQDVQMHVERMWVQNLCPGPDAYEYFEDTTAVIVPHLAISEPCQRCARYFKPDENQIDSCRFVGRWLVTKNRLKETTAVRTLTFDLVYVGILLDGICSAASVSAGTAIPTLRRFHDTEDGEAGEFRPVKSTGGADSAPPRRRGVMQRAHSFGGSSPRPLERFKSTWT